STLNGKANFRFLHHGLRPQRRKVIAIKRDIERADRNLLLFDLLNHLAQPFGDGNSATANSDQAQAVDTTVFLQDFVSEPYQRAFNLRTRHQLGLLPERCFEYRIPLCSHAAHTSSNLVCFRKISCCSALQPSRYLASFSGSFPADGRSLLSDSLLSGSGAASMRILVLSGSP